MVAVICFRNAESILNCMETKVPEAQSPVDKFIKDVLDLTALRNLVTSKCSVQNGKFWYHCNKEVFSEKINCHTKLSELSFYSLVSVNFTG